MNRFERPDAHQRFKELAALAHGRALNDGERQELENHLRVCASCREAYDEYGFISTTGMSFLAAARSTTDEIESWDERPAREKILARVRKSDPPRSAESTTQLLRLSRTLLLAADSVPRVAIGLAACLLIAVAVGAYHLGHRTGVARFNTTQISDSSQRSLVLGKTASEEIISSQKLQLSRLENQLSADAQEIATLHDAVHAAEARSSVLQTANNAANGQIQQISAERNRLIEQLHDAEQSYQLVQAQLTSLRAEQERGLLHTTSLESKVDELSAANRDQDRKIRDDEQYLASDRDIRELMGARKLYIADVFDVDSGSRTRKPFGRVFYTESKSLIFYAFDLDHQPGVKTASAFQVWGERDGEARMQNRATNLGILYMDSESNRRWVLRLDDPKQLAEIDAVFVTVEPQGGSQKPTGKPFLYALLRREANHP